MSKSIEGLQASSFQPSWTAAELMAGLPYAVYTTDDRGFILNFNRAAVELWGMEPEPGVTRWCGSAHLLDADGRPVAHEDCALARSLREGREMRGERMLLQRPDGQRIAFHAYPSLLRNENGDIIGASNTLMADEGPTMDEELHSRLAALVTSSHDVIVSKDLNGIVTSWNTSAERVFGYRADEIVGKSITLIIPPERLAEEPVILERIRGGDVVDHFETVRMRKDGQRIPISLTISPIRSSRGTIIGVSKIARDITDRKDSERRIGELLREVNHRVKNQFAVILSMVRETNSRTSDPVQFERLVRERIMALSRTHDLLVHNEWRGVSLRDLILVHLRAAGDEDLLTLSGPELSLSPMAAQYLGMALQELLMNSSWDGALGAADPLVVSWKVRTNGNGERLKLEWLEPFSGLQLFQSDEGSFSEIVLVKAMPKAVDGRADLTLEDGRLRWTLDAPISALAPRPELNETGLS